MSLGMIMGDKKEVGSCQLADSNTFGLMASFANEISANWQLLPKAFGTNFTLPQP